MCSYTHHLSCPYITKHVLTGARKRSDVKQEVLILTDGQSDNQRLTLQAV